MGILTKIRLAVQEKQSAALMEKSKYEPLPVSQSSFACGDIVPALGKNKRLYLVADVHGGVARVYGLTEKEHFYRHGEAIKLLRQDYDLEKDLFLVASQVIEINESIVLTPVAKIKREDADALNRLLDASGRNNKDFPRVTIETKIKAPCAIKLDPGMFFVRRIDAGKAYVYPLRKRTSDLVVICEGEEYWLTLGEGRMIDLPVSPTTLPLENEVHALLETLDPLPIAISYRYPCGTFLGFLDESIVYLFTHEGSDYGVMKADIAQPVIVDVTHLQTTVMYDALPLDQLKEMLGKLATRYQACLQALEDL